MIKKSFKKKGTKTKDLLKIIYSDVCGPMRTSTRDDFRYFITFTDDYSHYSYIYLMKNKSESFNKFKKFKNEVENQLDKIIKNL
jgi:hypothetical protein